MTRILSVSNIVSRRFARTNNIENWTHIDKLDQLKGLRDVTLIVIEGWASRTCPIKRVALKAELLLFKLRNDIIFVQH